MGRYVALLRGINVGGKNLIAMPALKRCFEAQGLQDVVTYIQSGNVLFSASESSKRLTATLESALSSAFRYNARIVLRSERQLERVVAGAPKGFGTEPARYRYDVAFLKEPLTAPAAMRSVRFKPGVDQVHAGTGVIYFSRLIAKVTQSWINRLPSMPVYQNMTLRNWNTTTRLLGLMQQPRG